MKQTTLKNSIASVIGLVLTTAGSTSAFQITPLPGNVGGNPGDQAVANYFALAYEVSGLKAGDAFNMDWLLEGSDSKTFNDDLPDLSATGMLTVDSLTASQIEFTVMLENTTSPSGILAAAITSFGLELDGFTNGGLINPGGFLDTYETGNIAGGTRLTTDFCASTNRQCTRGKAADGINIDQSDTFTFQIAGNFDTEFGVTMRHFTTKWQTNYDNIVELPTTVNRGDNSSFELAGIITGQKESVASVPEPLTILGTLTAVGFGYGMRRKQSSSS